MRTHRGSPGTARFALCGCLSNRAAESRLCGHHEHGKCGYCGRIVARIVIEHAQPVTRRRCCRGKHRTVARARTRQLGGGGGGGGSRLRCDAQPGEQPRTLRERDRMTGDGCGYRASAASGTPSKAIVIGSATRAVSTSAEAGSSARFSCTGPATLFCTGSTAASARPARTAAMASIAVGKGRARAAGSKRAHACSPNAAGSP